MSQNPIAFMSYAHSDDEHEKGRLTHLREALSKEVKFQAAEEFEIFQDCEGIALGEPWEKSIEDSLSSVTFLIPIITPAFFKSEYCRDELEKFLKREKELGRNDLILPIYYAECAELSNEAKWKQNPLAKVIASRQRIDCRDDRFEPLTSPYMRKRIENMARQIVKALERSQPASSDPVASGKTKPTAHKGRHSSKQDQYVQEDAAELASRPVRPPALKTEMPVLVVDALYRGDYTTLSAALKVADPGTRILVRPGLYKENIIIDKPIEIIGDGEQSDVIIEASGNPAVTFRANMGRITNLTLRQKGGGEFPCVEITQGRLDLEGCDITGQGSDCVAIHSGADPRLRRNRIHDGKESGVWIYDNGMGTLEDNDIFANELPGINISDDGNPTLRKNRIHDGKSDGVYITDNGMGTLEDNDIFANESYGVAISDGGNATLRKNHILKNTEQGIYVGAGGGGLFEENVLRDNKEGAWYIHPKAKGKVKLVRNTE